MKLRTAFALTFSIFAFTAHAEKIALVRGTLINPATSQVLENSVVVIDGDRVTAVGSRKEMAVPTGSKWVDCKGRFILPGYIDTHDGPKMSNHQLTDIQQKIIGAAKI